MIVEKNAKARMSQTTIESAAGGRRLGSEA